MKYTRLAAAVIAIAAFASSNALAVSGDGVTYNPEVLLIKFREQPLGKYTGGVDGLNATARSATGQRLDPDSPDARAYLNWLHARQDEHLESISSKVGRQVDVIFRYDILMNGVAIRAQAGDLDRIKSLNVVKAVAFDRIYPLHTDRGPQWIGADTVWDGSGTGGLGATRGEGIIIGVLDTGINFGHPSFSDDPDDGYNYVNPNGSGNFLGFCDPGHPEHEPQFECNDKVIGAWDFADPVSGGQEDDGPVDNDGHGSHTASTAGGNTLISPAISGVAPHASIIAYDVCYPPPNPNVGGCAFSATSAAAQQALMDGVDVINYSIGGGITPWSEFDIDSFFLDLVANGTFVSASAGNAGPAAGTTGHNGPWMSASAASTHDRQGVQNMLINMSGGNSPPADITGQSRTSGYGPESVVYAGDYSNGDPNPEQCLNPFPANTWTSGEIVLCDRGTIARVLKCANVAAGGAGGCILADVSGSTGPVADPHVIPAIHVAEADGDALRAWLASGSNHMGTITAGNVIVNPAVADHVANFSSRGPASFDVIKPDVAAPGVQIFAAVNAGGIPGFPGPDFGTISGTSMASPHTAGSAALLKALHPGWSPPEVKSALMSTAVSSMVLEDGVTPADPFVRGAGRLDVSAASQAGLVLDESEANFLAANPDTGGDPRVLNLASMMDSRCVVVCTFTRTVKNARAFTTNWTFSQTEGPSDLDISANPSSFALASGATQEIEFTVTITGGGGGFLFGEGTFTEDGGLSSTAHFTVAVNEATLSIEAISIESLERSGNVVLNDVRTNGASDLQLSFAGVVPLQRSRDEVAQDPTNSSAFDSDAGTVTYWLNGLVDNRRIHASTFESDAPDLDLFVGRDINMDGNPQAGEVVCSSTTASADEECEIMDPQDGDWWVRVQNWQGSGAPTDTFTVHFGAVGPADEGNFNAAPSNASPNPGEAFELTVSWDFGPTGGNGAFIGVMDVGTSPGNPDDLGTVTVDFFNDRVQSSGFEE